MEGLRGQIVKIDFLRNLMKVIFRERRRTKSNYEQLQKIIDETLTKYVDPDIIKELKLEIVLQKMLDCGAIYEEGCLPFRRFRITLNNEKYPWRLKQSLRHELIHLKQIVNGEQIPAAADFKTMWKGEDHTDTDYYDCPWEIEAYELENIR